MNKLPYIACILSLSGSVVFAEGYRDDPKFYLKDTNSVTHISQLVLPTLSFNKDISVPSGFVNLDGPLLFQGGREVALNRVDKARPYCALGGSYTGESDKDHHVFKARQRLRIKGPLTYQSIESQMELSKNKFSYKKEITVDLLLQGGFGSLDLNQRYLENGALTKTAFPYPEDDFDTFFGSLKCFKFSKMPTVGAIRKIIGSENLSIMPDDSEPMALQSGENKFRNDEDGFMTGIKEFFQSIKGQTQSYGNRESINDSSLGKTSSGSASKVRSIQGSASRQ